MWVVGGEDRRRELVEGIPASLYTDIWTKMIIMHADP